MMSQNIFLSIVIPAYNEEQNIVSTLSEISGYLAGKKFVSETIIVDDGSRDKTVQQARESGKLLENFKIIESRPNRGKGYALKKGMLEAKGEYILFMDADNSTSIKELDKFLSARNEGFDIYISSRRLKGARVEVPFERKLLGNIYILFSRIILGVRVSDINCGFKMFRNEVVKTIFSKQTMNDWSFDAEDLFLAGKYKYRVKEIPVVWAHKATSKVKPFWDGINSFLSLLRIRLNAMNGKYG